jgi:copper chaperone CopZ
VLVIMGMRDNACRERVAEALGQIDGVLSTNVSLIRARATVVHEPPCDAAQLVWTVVNAGYGAALETRPPDEAARPGDGRSSRTH